MVKFDDQDNILEEIKQLAISENIRIASIQLIGGIRSAAVVTGPKETMIPPEPVWAQVNDGREVVAFGTIVWNETEPAIHLHGALGRGDSTITGCIRRDAKTYLVIEALITEITGIRALKKMNAVAGLSMLELQ